MVSVGAHDSRASGEGIRWTADSPEILVGWQSHLAVWCNFIAPRLVEKVLLMAALSIDKSTTKIL